MKGKNFRDLCERLLAEGVKPTPTEFARRGWPYVTVANNRLYARQGRPPCPTPGSGTTWSQGRYAAIRREVLIAHGWTWRPYDKHNPLAYDGYGEWDPPVATS